MMYPSIIDIISNMHWRTVCIIHSYVYSKESLALSNLLIQEGVAVSLINFEEDDSQCAFQTEVVVAFDMVAACSISERIPILLPSIEEREDLTSCHSRNINIYQLSLERHTLERSLYSELSSSLGIDLSKERALGDAICSYDSMMIALLALKGTSTRDDLLEQIQTLSENIRYNGQLTHTNSSVGARNKKATQIIVTRKNELGVSRAIGEWTKEMGLNLTENITAGNVEEYTDSYVDEFSSQLTALGFFSAFALLGIAYSIALIAFNCLKSKDRTIKLTSPNINVMTCLGALLTLVSMLLLGIEHPITTDLVCIGRLQQAGVFAVSVGITIIQSTILVKTWRVHRIFKKMHISTKGTKDEVLILMIIGLTLIDVAINGTWAKIDRIQCTDNSMFNQQNGGVLLCRSQYQAVWSCLLTGYKVFLTLLTLFYAWHVRHIKLPSLKDSQLILMNSLISIAVLLTSLPALASTETTNNIRFTTLSLSATTTVFSTLSLLLAPKIFLLRNKDDMKSKSAVRFLFGESMKKQKTRDEPPSGCWANLKSRGSQSGSTMGDSVLSQEIETLKQLVKEKDDTIRELNDRLFFGADNFKAYINDKTNASRKASTQSTDTLIPSISGGDNQQYQRSRSWQKRANQKPQFSPASSVDSGNVDDMFSTRSQNRTQPNNFHTLDNYKYPTHNHSREHNSMSHTLPPIRELSVNDLTNHSSKHEYSANQQYPAERSATPTTDSAINMSRSASSSEDESYHHRHSSPSMHEVAERMRRVAIQQSEDVEPQYSGYSSSDDHTLKSTSTVLTTATLTPSTETPDIEPINSGHSTIQKSVDQSATYKVRDGHHSRLSIDNDRRAENSRQLRTSHSPLKVDSKYCSNTGYSNSLVHQLNESVVGDEVELEIVFPVAKIL